MRWDAIVVGGGLAGLTSAILLARQKYAVLLIEAKQYPFHRVCGEYVSNEVLPFLQHHGLYPEHLELPQINQFLLTTTSGQSARAPLQMGGFGISRYVLDEHLAGKAQEAGAILALGCKVTEITYKDDRFFVQRSDGHVDQAPVVIGAYGKRSRLDHQLKRHFIKKSSDYIGVKYHIRGSFEADTVALHNFDGGYCGISRVENDLYNLCYLGSRKQLQHYGSIQEMERQKLFKNPWLRDIFQEATFAFDKPAAISEVSFLPKEPITDHILMAGDAAGLITPLCGNGMAMAIHAGKIAADVVAAYYQHGQRNRAAMEAQYRQRWRHAFALRLQVGRTAQATFHRLAQLPVALMRYWPGLARQVISKTHGQPFV
jgi:flavin-dependent dehydrogenase